MILTSNLGSNYIQEGIEADGAIGEAARKQVDMLLKTHFRPEFLNRLDEIVLYTPLGRDEITKIMKLMIGNLEKRLEERRISITLTPACENFIIENGYDIAYGARPLKRFIQRSIETAVAKLLIAEYVPEGSRLTIDAEDDEIKIHRSDSISVE